MFFAGFLRGGSFGATSAKALGDKSTAPVGDAYGT
jgi:hypothetical protein